MAWRKESPTRVVGVLVGATSSKRILKRCTTRSSQRLILGKMFQTWMVLVCREVCFRMRSAARVQSCQRTPVRLKWNSTAPSLNFTTAQWKRLSTRLRRCNTTAEQQKWLWDRSKSKLTPDSMRRLSLFSREKDTRCLKVLPPTLLWNSSKHRTRITNATATT